LGAFPWKFFQLNAPYFNKTKGIYSKLDIDQCIPERWRLFQVPVTPEFTPEKFPVFLKPEWGQNSHGIMRIDALDDMPEARERVLTKKVAYMVQEAASGLREFEIFYIRSPKDERNCALLSVTEVKNTCVDRYPINGIHNKCTVYKNFSNHISDRDVDLLWNHFKNLCAYRIARIGLRADAFEDILAGNFHIIEINLFLPMPLSLLDKDLPWRKKSAFIKKAMYLAADLTRRLPGDAERRPIFFRKLLAHYKVTT